MSAVWNSVQPRGIIWPLAVQVRSGLVLGCERPISLVFVLWIETVSWSRIKSLTHVIVIKNDFLEMCCYCWTLDSVNTLHATAVRPCRPQHFICGFTDSGGPHKLLKTSFVTLPKGEIRIWNVLLYTETIFQVARTGRAAYKLLCYPGVNCPGLFTPFPVSLKVQVHWAWKKETPPWPRSCWFTGVKLGHWNKSQQA